MLKGAAEGARSLVSSMLSSFTTILFPFSRLPSFLLEAFLLLEAFENRHIVDVANRLLFQHVLNGDFEGE